MDIVHRIRIIFAAVVAVAAAGSIALAEIGVAGGGQLLPDLRTMKPFDFDPLRLAHNSSGKVTLRISNRIGNQGEGPLELYPEAASQQCRPGEYPDDNDLDANQAIFGDTNPNGQWDHGDEVVSTPRVGCFEYHPAHAHWHFQDFSLYSLTDPDTEEVVAGPSRKIGFCILDGDRFKRLGEYLPGSPGSGRYPSGTGCGGPNWQDPEDPPIPPGRMGLSVGWADTYTSSLPGQRLNIAGVPKGTYCLVSTANPKHAVDEPSQIVESNPNNNSRRRLIKLNPPKNRVELTGEGCPTP